MKCRYAHDVYLQEYMLCPYKDKNTYDIIIGNKKNHAPLFHDHECLVEYG